MPPSIKTVDCRKIVFLATCSLPVFSEADETVLPPQNGEIIPAGPREVIKEAIIQKEDHTLTVREVVPPQAVLRPDSVPVPVQPADDEESLPKRFFIATASCFDEKATLLEWWMDDEKFQAWSPVNFQHLDGMVEFQDRGVRFHAMCLVAKRRLPQAPLNEMTDREQLIAAGPTSDALGGQPLLITGSESNGEAMDFLYGIHDYYNQNRDALTEAYAARIQQRLVPRPAPPVQSRPDKTVTYWKYHKSTQSQER